MNALFTTLWVAVMLQTGLTLPVLAQIQFDPDFIGMRCDANIACGYDSKGQLRSGEYGWYGEYCGTSAEEMFEAYSDQLIEIREQLKNPDLSESEKISLRKGSKIIRAWKSANDRICLRGPHQNDCSNRMTLLSNAISVNYGEHLLDCEPPNGVSTQAIYHGISPEVRWVNLPERAQRLVLLVVQKATNQIHWFILIEKDSPYWQNGLPEGLPISANSEAVDGLVQFENGFGVHGYTAGPCLPTDLRFELYALRKMKTNDFGEDVVSIRESLRRYSIKRTTKSGKYSLYSCE